MSREREMIIENKLLRRIYFINILLVIILFITPLIIYIINNYSNIDIHSLLSVIFIIMEVIGVTFGLTFLILNIIVLIKYKKIIFLIITIFILLWVMYSFYFIRFLKYL